MRQVTGNNQNNNQYTEISIQVTVNGFSFIVHTVDVNGGKKIVAKKTFSGHNVENLNAFNINVNNVTVVWSGVDVELVPAEMETVCESENVMTNCQHNPNMVAKWTLKEWEVDVSQQIETIFGNVYHIHCLQTMVCDSNVVKIVQADDVAYVVVMGNNNLENYIVTKFKTVADIVYVANKLMKEGRKYQYKIVGDNKVVVSALEKVTKTNSTLTANPIALICE